jgi:hypothetical protein
VRLLDATNDLTPAEPLPIIAPRRIDHFLRRLSILPLVRWSERASGTEGGWLAGATALHSSELEALHAATRRATIV